MTQSDKYFSTLNGYKIRDQEAHDRLDKWEESSPIKFTTDKTLTLSEDGILSVNTVNEMNDATADNTLPITAAAVNVTVGNIEILLQTI